MYEVIQVHNAGAKPNRWYLRQIDGSFALEVLPSIVVSELVFDGVQHKPSLFPGLQQGSPLVQIALQANVKIC